jgi:gas vesicle protein
MKDVTKIIGGLIAGAAIGAAVGILLAPSSGLKTRKRIASRSRKLKQNAKDYIDDSMESMRKQLNTRIDKLVTSGKQLVNHATERVKV